jgi:hypothetical protein
MPPFCGPTPGTGDAAGDHDANRRHVRWCMLMRAGRLFIGRPQAWLAAGLGMLLVLSEPGLLARTTAEARSDIYYIWRDGVRLANGENPYAYDHIPEPDERSTKHPSYLPLFYLAVAGAHRLGIQEYATWMLVWKAVRILSHVAIAVMLYLAGQRTGRPLLGLFGALFWSLNRWSLYSVRSGGLDELALLFLLGSLECFGRRRRFAFLLFGTSLAIKHVGLLVAPLYLVWTWHRSSRHPRWVRWTAVGQAVLWIALIPVAVSLPFIWWDAGAFTRSILSSVVRSRDGYAHVSAVGSLLGLRGGWARVPLLLLLTLVVLVAAHRQVIGRYTAVLLMFAAFTDFNTVLFPQYFVWVIPFIALAAGEGAAVPSRAVPEATS